MSATVPPSTFLGSTGGGVTGSMYQQQGGQPPPPPPPSAQPGSRFSNTNTMMADIDGNNQVVDANGHVLADPQSLFMFTTVGYVGLHFVLRPLFRWGMRSLLMPAKSYYDNNNNNNNNKNENNKNKSKSKSKSKMKSPSNNSDVNEELEELNDNNDNNSESNLSTLSIKKSKKKRTLLADSPSGLCSAYAETVTTFGALTFISQFAHPNNVLLYFGVFYPSYPFVLRCMQTLNDKKSKITVARVSRLIGKGMITTGGFALSMVFVGYYLQTVPFLNVLGLTFWDCVADYLISDGPDR